MKPFTQESETVVCGANEAATPATAIPIGGPAPCLPAADEVCAVDKPPALASRIVDLISTEPIDHAIGCLGLVTVFLLSEATDPLQALEDLSAKLREILTEDTRRDEAVPLAH